MPEERTPQAVDGYVVEELDGELVVYHPSTENIFYCNPTAALILRLVDGERAESVIVETLVAAYPEGRGTISQDVAKTLDALVAHGALAWAG
jgi:hypothetical protein